MTTWSHGGEDHRGRVYDPGLPAELLTKQEVMANGAYCGFVLQSLARLDWYDTRVRYPLDFFDPDEAPVFTPDTAETRDRDAENLPILAWIVSADGGKAVAVVDILEKAQYRVPPGGDAPEPIPPANCKIIGGSTRDILPPELLERMRLG